MTSRRATKRLRLLDSDAPTQTTGIYMRDAGVRVVDPPGEERYYLVTINGWDMDEMEKHPHGTPGHDDPVVATQDILIDQAGFDSFVAFLNKVKASEAQEKFRGDQD